MQRTQHDKIGSPNAEADFSSEDGKKEHAAMRSAISTFIVGACALVACILWCLEPWQRPEFLRKFPDAILFSTACLGLVGLAVMMGLRLKTARRWQWMFVLGVCGITLLGGMRLLFDSLALSYLENRIDRKISDPFSSSGIPSKSISEKLIGTLEALHLGVPDWLSKHAQQQQYQFIITPTLESHIASSRCPLRRALADSMVRNDSRAAFLMLYWKEYFPAITGADVSLEIRREWISRLDALKRDVSLGDRSRQAAIFCMALVILTDPPEFENWRIPVRDAMLGCGKPLEPEVWLRTLDTLLALDPPDSWVELTEPLTANHDLFRYAMQVPVRGLVGHLDALSSEFEFSDFQPASNLWHGAGASLEAWPDIFGKSETERIRNWLRDAQFHRLMTFGNYTLDKIGNTKTRALLEFTPEQQQQLAATATGWARLASEGIVSASNNEKPILLERLASIRRIHPYLTNNQQTELGRLLIPVMLRPGHFHKFGQLKSYRFDSDWVKLLWEIHPLMTAEERKSLQTALIPYMENLDSRDPTSAILLCMDAWSDMPVLTQEKWLASVWVASSNWRIVPRNTSRESLDPFAGDGQLPVPPLADSVVKTLATHLKEVSSIRDKKACCQVFHLALNGGDSSAPPSPVIAFRNYSEIKNWQSSGNLTYHSLEELLEIRLYLKGLRVPDQDGLRALKKLVKNDRDLHWWWLILNRSANRAGPWNDVGADPQEVVQWIGQANSMFLEVMLACIENFPPDATIIRTIWDELRKRSRNANIENKTEIFGALFRLSRWLPRDERLAMRRDFLAAPHSNEFKSPTYDVHYVYCDCGPSLSHLGGGFGIPWEDDQLSAELSWRSNVERQAHLCPAMSPELYANDVFSFLALGSDRERVSCQWNKKNTAMPRLTPPFEPTPWQRARELHLRRPDLDIK